MTLQPASTCKPCPSLLWWFPATKFHGRVKTSPGVSVPLLHWAWQASRLPQAEAWSPRCAVYISEQSRWIWADPAWGWGCLHRQVYTDACFTKTQESSANGTGLSSKTGCILLCLTWVTQLWCVPKRDWIVFLRCPLWFLYVSRLLRSWQSCWLQVLAEAYAKRSLTEASHFSRPCKVHKVKLKQPSIGPGKKNTGILSHVFLFR